eukprot:5100478-Prymnesium_polylepis.1
MVIARLAHIMAEDMQKHGTAGKDMGPFAPPSGEAQLVRAEGRGGGGGARGGGGRGGGGGAAAPARGRGRGR